MCFCVNYVVEQKQIERIGESVEAFKASRRAFLVSDSKGRCLSRHLTRRDYLDIVWKSGAQSGNDDLMSRLKVKLEGLDRQTVFLWLGTCDFTRKGPRANVSIREVDSREVVMFLQEMKKMS